MANFIRSNQDYLRMFDFEYIEGSPESAIAKGNCIISEAFAKKIFGDKLAYGEKINWYRTEYAIGAVVKLPENTQNNFDVLDLNPMFTSYGVQYIMLRENEKMTPALEKQISSFLSTLQNTENTLMVQSLGDVHLHSPSEVAKHKQHGYSETYGSYSQIIYFSAAVLFILLMAIINYVNTSIARTINKMKEVGVRKITGASRKQLMERFLFDSFVVTILAAVISLSITKYLFPAFSEIMGNRLNLNFDWLTILLTLLVCFVIAGLSGGYAAFYLSAMKPGAILKGGINPSSKDHLRKVLLSTQFFLSIGILICTFFIYKQLYTIYNESTGMDRSNIIVLDSNLWYESEDFIKIIKQENSNIIDACMANCPPYNAPWSYTGETWEGNDKDMSNVSFTRIFCDSHYANTFGLEIVQGKFIEPGLPWWHNAKPESFNIVVNESFVKLMEVDNPIGVTVNEGKIIGVVKDFNFKPLKEKSNPLILCFDPENSSKMFIKTTGKNKQETLNYILDKYKEMKPKWTNRPIIHYTIDDEYKIMYSEEIRTAKVLAFFSIISFLLSMMGAASMVSFMIEKRSKEIAIRKINGAKVFDIIILFWKDITKIAVIASALVIPCSYILMNSWLEGYIYRTTLSWWVFVLIPLLLIFLLCGIIALQVIYTAGKRPVESLRNE